MTIDGRTIGVVHSFVAATFPAAHGVVLAGSLASGNGTATSDIDLLLIGSNDLFEGERTSLAATYEHAGRLVEVFAYTPDAFRTWAAREVDAHRPVILTMISEGAVLRSSEELTTLRQWAANTLAAGPAIDKHALDLRGYRVSSLLDDVSDATDYGERAFLLANAFMSIAELVLLADGCWLGSGKWLLRRLRHWDGTRAQSLIETLVCGDVDSLVMQADELLAPLGGRLHAGMTR